MSDDPEPCCANCRFMLMNACHRHAPMAKASGDTSQVKRAVWPRVYDDDWCGEWEAEDGA